MLQQTPPAIVRKCRGDEPAETHAAAGVSTQHREMGT